MQVLIVFLFARFCRRREDKIYETCQAFKAEIIEFICSIPPDWERDATHRALSQILKILAGPTTGEKNISTINHIQKCNKVRG